MSHSRVPGALLLLFVAGILLFPLPVLAAEGDPPPSDFRGRVMLGFSLVFGLVVVYLVISHRRNARLGEEVEFLSRRVQEIETTVESGSGPVAHPRGDAASPPPVPR